MRGDGAGLSGIGAITPHQRLLAQTLPSTGAMNMWLELLEFQFVHRTRTIRKHFGNAHSICVHGN